MPWRDDWSVLGRAAIFNHATVSAIRIGYRLAARRRHTDRVRLFIAERHYQGGWRYNHHVPQLDVDVDGVLSLANYLQEAREKDAELAQRYAEARAKEGQ